MPAHFFIFSLFLFSAEDESFIAQSRSLFDMDLSNITKNGTCNTTVNINSKKCVEALRCSKRESVAERESIISNTFPLQGIVFLYHHRERLFCLLSHLTKCTDKKHCLQRCPISRKVAQALKIVISKIHLNFLLRVHQY